MDTPQNRARGHRSGIRARLEGVQILYSPARLATVAAQQLTVCTSVLYYRAQTNHSRDFPSCVRVSIMGLPVRAIAMWHTYEDMVIVLLGRGSFQKKFHITSHAEISLYLI